MLQVTQQVGGGVRSRPQRLVAKRELDMDAWLIQSGT